MIGAFKNVTQYTHFVDTEDMPRLELEIDTLLSIYTEIQYWSYNKKYTTRKTRLQHDEYAKGELTNNY